MNIEEERLGLQARLDAAKSQAERNRMGQFATPTALAIDILRYARSNMGANETIRFLDPAIGTGAFYSALLQVFGKGQIDRAVGYEVDPHYALPATRLWTEHRLEIRLQDFTHEQPPELGQRYNLLICNPPYVRHHHLTSEDKRRLKARTRDLLGVEISGLAGLYCYFMGLSHDWMADGGLAGWLIPSEFMDVNYGTAVKHYLLEKVTLTHIHRFDPTEVQFDDALVSSAVVWFRKTPPPENHNVRFTFGGTLERPRLERQIPVDILRDDRKWTSYPAKKASTTDNALTLGDLFTIKRGVATGSNSYFILTPAQISQYKLPMAAFRPILPSPRYLPADEIAADKGGNPILEKRLFLMNCRLPEKEVQARYPTLWTYLQRGKTEGISERYLCRHRSPWYAQEDRPPAPFVCTYLGRPGKNGDRPFRFILNHSTATAANVYLMLYPKPVLKNAIHADPGLERKVWLLLNEIGPKALLDQGRVYGGGLHKLEPNELANVPGTDIAHMVPEFKVPVVSTQLSFF